MSNIKHAAFGGVISPKQLLQAALDLESIKGLSLVVFTNDGEIHVVSAGLDTAQVVYAGNALIMEEFGL